MTESERRARLAELDEIDRRLDETHRHTRFTINIIDGRRRDLRRGYDGDCGEDKD